MIAYRPVAASRAVFICVAALAMFSTACFAHPDLLEQISQVTARIQTNGQSSQLLQERADLFRRHAQFEAALADIAAAEKLQKNEPALILARARIFSDAGMATQAVTSLQAYFQFATNDPEAFFIRARNEARLSQTPAAISDYTTAIKLSPVPSAEMYLERARQQARLGWFDDAVRGLDEAMSGGAEPSVLQLSAIEYDRKRKAFVSAIKRVDGFIERYPVKEPWLVLRAEILEQAGRTEEARATYQQVVTGIEKYSKDRRSLPLTKQLESRAEQGLARTQTALAKNSKP